MLRRMKTWSEMLTEKEVRKSKVYHVGAKFVYDGGDVPDGLAVSIGCVLCLQRTHGISATQMPGNAEDWIVVGGGSGGGGSITLKTINGQSLFGSGNIQINECNCGFTAAQLAKLKNMPSITISGNIITINGIDYELTPASSPVTKYTITTAVNNSKMGSVTGGGQYSSGATATLVATANSGYHFVQWQDGNTNATRTVTVTQNKTYTATFAADEPAPSAAPDYLVGWTNATKSDFNALSDAQLEALATGYEVAQQASYTHAFGQNNIFFLLYKATLPPQALTLTSSGQSMAQNIETDNTFSGHADVEVDGQSFKLFGIRLSSGYDASDTITVTFNN